MENYSRDNNKIREFYENKAGIWTLDGHCLETSMN